MKSDLGVIPDAHRAATAQAFTETFGGLSIRKITPISGGRSAALVYRVDLLDRSAVLRIVTQRTRLANPHRHFAAMQIASEDGIAPRVYYANADSGIAITAFIQAVPWNEPSAAMPDRIAEFGRQVRRLHNGPAFPEFLDAFQCIDEGLAVVRGAGATLPPMLVTYLEEFASVREVLSPNCILRASHNDLNPGNLLFDGARSWIIDWESAWQNDPMFDVATVLHWFGFSGEPETALLRGYFRGEPTALEAAKLVAMRQVVSCYYATIFLLLTLQHGELPPPLDPDADTLPSFADSRSALRAGTLALDTAEDRVRFALIMINDARRAARQPGLAKALEVLQAHA